MFGLAFDHIGAEIHDEETRLLLERIRIGLAILLASVAIYAFGDILVGRGGLSVHLLHLIQVGIALIVLRTLRLPEIRHWAVAVALLTVTTICITTAGKGIVRHEVANATVLCMVIVFGAGTLLPWGVGPQVLTVVMVGLALLWNVSQVSGSLAAVLGYPALGVMVAFAISVYVTFELTRSREEKARSDAEHKRAKEEKAVLLDVARDIAGTLDFDELLARVQKRTADVLPCNALVTLYWDRAHKIFRVASHYGVPANLASEVKALQFPREAHFGRRLAAGEVVIVNDFDEWPDLRAVMPAASNVSALMAAPLTVGGRRVGILVAFSAGNHRFSPAQGQLFESIAGQLAVAIEASELYRSQQEEAEVSNALVRVGQELIASLEAPALLERLCQVTTEVLGCDCSHTWLWQAQDEAFSPIAGYGDSPEQWESIRVLRIPSEMVTKLLAKLEREHIAQMTVAESQDLLPTALPRQYGVTAAVFMALRRGGEIVGIQAAGYRGRQETFSRVQERIARGLAHIASLAFQNMRLVEERERANRVKSDFLATMSHELRTPLNVIIGYNDLLFEGAFGNPTAEQADALQRVGNSAHQLLEMVNSTLDLSRFEAGKMPLTLQEIAVTDLLAEIEAETRPTVNEKPEVLLTWDISPDLPRLRTDPVKMKVVLKNLISNAVKFTDRGSVTVAGHTNDGGVEFCVTDTGIGIPNEEQAFVFEPFRQAEAALTRSHGGVGLGLYIVRRLLDAMGGTITLDSEIGRGSKFLVWVPCSEAKAN